MLARPAALIIAAAFCAILALMGMPKLPLLVLGGASAGLAFTLTKRRAAAAEAAAAAANAESGDAKSADAVEKLLDVQPMEMLLGHGLVRLADPEKGGDLMDRVAKI